MKILRMQATFGKLENAQLTLEPGLNILQGENEWGKSTWCAFLLAMLYGLDTRAKTTKTALADKERYIPWSGSPMAGRIDLEWKDRKITIERSTKGRIPLGAFRAYETESGLAVEELTAANCGQQLLGVEQSVLRRAGFIRLNDLPVNEDEALRRRLNALVTTGDESGEEERLEKGLRELKNRCRYHRTGLLPQAEAERDSLENKLAELQSLQGHITALEERLEEEKKWYGQLVNHRSALEQAAAEADAARVAQAQAEYTRAAEALAQLEQTCSRLPSRETAREKLHQLKIYREQWEEIQQQLQQLPAEPEQPRQFSPFLGMTPEQAEHKVREDTRRYEELNRGRSTATVGGTVLALVLAAVFAWSGWLYPMGAALMAAVVILLLGVRSVRIRKTAILVLQKEYEAATPEDWNRQLEEFRQQTREHTRQLLRCRTARGDLDSRLEGLKTVRQSLCGSQTPEKVAQIWQQTLEQWDRREQAQTRCTQTECHLQTLKAMAKPVMEPVGEDSLALSRTETATLLEESSREQQRLQQRLGQYRGRMEGLGQRGELETALEAVRRRIGELEKVFEAVTLALKTLEEAKQELQRRFAPRISRRAQVLLEQLTRGKYRQLKLNRDLSIHAQAQGEPVLREVLWRSDGTVDQLYLALRLAVAEELTPESPLVLDDALVRFDDKRLEAALAVLREMAEHKQILLFTCQSREGAVLKSK